MIQYIYIYRVYIYRYIHIYIYIYIYIASLFQTLTQAPLEVFWGQVYAARSDHWQNRVSCGSGDSSVTRRELGRSSKLWWIFPMDEGRGVHISHMRAMVLVYLPTFWWFLGQMLVNNYSIHGAYGYGFLFQRLRKCWSTIKYGNIQAFLLKLRPKEGFLTHIELTNLQTCGSLRIHCRRQHHHHQHQQPAPAPSQ